jgi:eukaryotic-like serine/threonine-protein kinase
MASGSETREEAFKPGDTLAGRYRLVRLLGEGGMGYVWEGQHLTTNRPVAIKTLKADNNLDATRLLREARLSASLSHRNIVQVFDFWELEGGGPVFMVMELLHGETLAAYLERVQKLSLKEARTIGVAVAAAMRAAHANGIVHRDLKPENIFLASSQDGGPPEIKVLDFGIAKPTIVDAQLTSVTRTGSVIGTPHYMAPEQVYGEKDIDGRADVWALGVVLYESISGKKPFDGENFGQVFRSVTLGRAVPLAELCPGAPPALSTLITAMLTVDRARRPTSVEAHEALEALGDLDGAARIPPFTQCLPAAPPPPSTSPILHATPPHAASATPGSLPPHHPAARHPSGSTFSPPWITPPASPPLASPAWTPSSPPATGRATIPVIVGIGAGAALVVAVVLGIFVMSRDQPPDRAPVVLEPISLPAAAAEPSGGDEIRSRAEERPAVDIGPPSSMVESPSPESPSSARAAPTASTASSSGRNVSSPALKPQPSPTTSTTTRPDPLGGGRF